MFVKLSEVKDNRKRDDIKIYTMSNPMFAKDRGRNCSQSPHLGFNLH